MIDIKDKIICRRDESNENAAEFIIKDENQTIGAILHQQLLQTPHVTFAGYNMPHPQEGKLFFRIETTSDSNPTQAFKSAIKEAMNNISILDTKFQYAIKKAQRRNMV